MDLPLAQRIQQNYGDKENRRFNNGDTEAAVLLNNVHLPIIFKSSVVKLKVHSLSPGLP